MPIAEVFIDSLLNGVVALWNGSFEFFLYNVFQCFNMVMGCENLELNVINN